MLLIGAATELLVGRWLRHPTWLNRLALVFTAAAVINFLALQFLQVVPSLGQPWQPLLQRAINLFWISESWNYYISGLILLFGSLGLLLERPRPPDAAPDVRRHTVLAMNLAVLAASLLFVNSGNLLTALLTWVFLDLMIMLRTAAEPASSQSQNGTIQVRTNEARILSLLGALILLIGLLPAGVAGPAQEFTQGTLPTETLFLMLVAAAIRAGVYPVHLWLLPRADTQFNLAERLLDHMAPVLCGLWLFGWTFRLGAAPLMLSVPVLTLIALSLLATAIVGWRRMAVLRPLKVVIENFPEGRSETLVGHNHPKDESMGSRELVFEREVYIDREDFREEAPGSYKRLVTGGEVRLRNSYVIRCDSVVNDLDGNVVELRCSYDPATLGHNPEGRKVRGVIHWVPATRAVPAEVRLYDRLFTVPSPDGDKDHDFKEFINPESLVTLQGCLLEPALADAQPGDRFQFEREGYFCPDSVDSTGGRLVFNRIVTLRDSWAKIASKGGA